MEKLICENYDYATELYMKRIDIILPDALEERFRSQVAKKMGMKKGNLSKAAQEAIEKWLVDDK